MTRLLDTRAAKLVWVLLLILTMAATMRWTLAGREQVLHDSAASAAPDRARFAAHVLLGFALLPEAAAVIAIGILVARRSSTGLRRLLAIVSAAELVSLFALGIMFTGI